MRESQPRRVGDMLSAKSERSQSSRGLPRRRDMRSTRTLGYVVVMEYRTRNAGGSPYVHREIVRQGDGTVTGFAKRSRADDYCRMRNRSARRNAIVPDKPAVKYRVLSREQANRMLRHGVSR